MLPRFLLRLTLAIAAGLLGLVVLAPRLSRFDNRVITLFGQDATLRRTAVASAFGLMATAGIFFRAPQPSNRQRPGSPRRLPLPPPGAGA
jgi:hypothetical protein